MIRTRFSRWGLLAICTAAALCCDLRIASAQSLFGSGGTTRQTGGAAGGVGGSSFGGSTGLTRSATSSSGFTSAFGGGSQAVGQNSGLNTSGLGAQTTGMQGPQLNTELGALSATVGQSGFVGGSDSAGRFVGQQFAGQQSIQGTNVGGLGQFGGGQFGDRSQSFNQQGGFNNRQTGFQTRRVVRPRLQIAFEHNAPDTSTIQTTLNGQFQRLRTSRPELQNVQIQIGDNREVVLRGRVTSENDKKLAAMLARLEPGVRSVKNELTIEGN